MYTACRGLSFVFVYLDGILIFSQSQEHEAHLRQLFGRLHEHGLVTSLSKCQFGVDEIDFLGHRVNQQGVFPLPEKVDAIRSFPRPTTVKQLQEYFGMVNFLSQICAISCCPHATTLQGHRYVLNVFIDIQTSKELIQMDTDKMMTYGTFTMDDEKLTQS